MNLCRVPWLQLVCLSMGSMHLALAMICIAANATWICVGLHLLCHFMQLFNAKPLGIASVLGHLIHFYGLSIMPMYACSATLSPEVTLRDIKLAKLAELKLIRENMQLLVANMGTGGFHAALPHGAQQVFDRPGGSSADSRVIIPSLTIKDKWLGPSPLDLATDPKHFKIRLAFERQPSYIAYRIRLLVYPLGNRIHIALWSCSIFVFICMNISCF